MDSEIAQIRYYWELESRLRERTEDMTAREKEELHALRPTLPQRSAMKYFGHPDAAEVLEEWACKLGKDRQPPIRPGTMVEPKEEIWTLLKGLMRARQHAESHDYTKFGACVCLCRTHFMPRGCGCKDDLGPNVVDSRICEKCSTCIRCGLLHAQLYRKVYHSYTYK